MLSIAIISYPRTATTPVYKRLTQWFSDEQGWLHLYEPFGLSSIKFALEAKLIWHDVEGEVHHDYARLPPELRMLIYENAKWQLDWMMSDEPRVPYLGEHYMRVLEELDKLRERVLIKDVYAWTRLRELAETFSKTIFVVTLREQEYVVDEIARWHPGRVTLNMLKSCFRHLKTALKLALRPQAAKHLYNIFRERSRNPRCGPYGVCLFYRFFYGLKSYPSRLDEKTLRHVVAATYSRFRWVVHEVEHMDNVIVLKFGNTLDLAEVDKIAHVIKQRLR